MENILVVDDSEEMRATMSAMLHDAGYGVKEAPDYETARTLLEQGGLSAIICDLALPARIGAEGEEGRLSLEVGENAVAEFTCDFPGIPVIAISGMAGEKGLAAIRQYGAVEALAKPFSEAQLISALHHVLGQTRGR